MFQCFTVSCYDELIILFQEINAQNQRVNKMEAKMLLIQKYSEALSNTVKLLELIRRGDVALTDLNNLILAIISKDDAESVQSIITFTLPYLLDGILQAITPNPDNQLKPAEIFDSILNNLKEIDGVRLRLVNFLKKYGVIKIKLFT